jgi:myo-inositol-1(or 4)-monophosphatase
MEDKAIDDRFDFARTVIAEAADLALSFHRQLGTLTVERKGPQDLVSEADRSVESLIRERVRSRYSDDGFVGEELGRVAAANGVWVVDPIDGTQDFLLDFPTWCVSIAFVVDGSIAFGLITCPSTGDRYSARRGAGAYLNDQTIRVSNAQSLADGVTSIGYSPRTRPDEIAVIVERLAAGGGAMRSIGSGAMMIVWVATGQCLGYTETFINAWDCLAALCVVAEAGGRTNDFLGEYGPAGSGPVIAAAPGVFEQVAALLP